jgi:hypothetical protein
MAQSRFSCVLAGLIFSGLTGRAMTSDVMDTGNGTYMISGHAAPIRGGATGANQVAYQDAQKFCAQRGAGFHAIVIGAEDRDVYQSSLGGSWGTNGGGLGGGTFAAGNAKLRFRCGPPES